MLSKTYSWLQNISGGWWIPKSVFVELFSAVVLLGHAETRIDKKFDTKLRASDASLWGGAFGSAPIAREQLESFLRSCDARGTSGRVQGPQFDSSHPKSTLSLLKVASESSRKDLTFSADVKWRWKFGSAPTVILEGLAFFGEVEISSSGSVPP